nr:MAG TPA: hypothetical protein [Caudoviricetes sp.]
MSRRKRKKPINWKDVAIRAVVDLLIGIILLLIQKYIIG